MSSDRTHSKNGQRFVPRGEALEDRVVPAGGVHAFVFEHVLYVAGDDAANRIRIDGAGTNTVFIRSTDGGETTINGQLVVRLTGITKGYHIRLAGGDDELLISGTRSKGGLNVDMGEGNNVLGITDARHKGDTLLAAGAGNDVIILHASDLARPVYVNTGFGDDTVVTAGVRARDFVMTNPGEADYFDNRGSALGRTTITGFLTGMRPPFAPPPTSPPPSSAPVAADDTATGAEDGGPVTGNVLTNDTDADANTTLSVASVNGSAANVGVPVAVAGGTVTVQANGSFAFAPAANFNGLATFTYTATDGTAASNTATVTITVTPVADLTATDDTFSTAEDTQLSGGVATNDSTTSGGTLTYVLTSGVVNGTLLFDAGGSFSYTPAANFTGTDSFTYTVTDAASGESATRTATVTVTPVNDPPVNTVPGTQTRAAGSNTSLPGISVADVDAGAAAVTVTVSVPVGSGTFTGTGFTTGDGTNSISVTDTLSAVNAALATLQYTAPLTGGPVIVTVFTNDNGNTGAGGALTDTDTFTITVTTGNGAPVAADDSATGAEDGGPITGNVLTNDTDADGALLSVSAVNGSAANVGVVVAITGGTVTVQANGSFSFAPAANFNGTATFTYTASDGTADSNAATVTITVTPTNDPPVAQDGGVTTDEDTARTFAVADFQFTDAESDALVSITIGTVSLATGDTLTVDLGAGPVAVTPGMTITAAQIPTLTYTPAADANGPSRSSFTFTVNDADPGIVAATMTIDVTAVNDPPVAMPVSGTADEDGPAVTLTADFTDPDAGDTFTYSVDTTGTLGTVTDNGDGTFTYDPSGAFEYLAAGETATDTFTYTVTDAGGASSTATVTVTITGQNDAPTANADADATDLATAIDIDVLANDTDPDATDSPTVTAVAPTSAEGATITINPDGTVHYDPTTITGVPAGMTVTDTFTYTIDDGNGGTAMATVTVTVTG